MKWISVNDELPKKNEPVLAFQKLDQYPQFNMMILGFDGEFFKGFNEDDDSLFTDGEYRGITHWMTLPEWPEYAKDPVKIEQKDWSKASDEELIAEAKRRYPEGTLIKSVYGTNHTVSFDFLMQNKTLYAGSIGSSICVYSPSLNQWAEILTQPEQPEPKAGDMVEVSDNGEDYSKYSHHTHKYLGVKRFYDGFFVVENQDGFISCHPFIRLPQKSEVEKFNQNFGDLLYSNSFSSVEDGINHTITKKWLMEMHYNAIKWGQQNPTKK